MITHCTCTCEVHTMSEHAEVVAAIKALARVLTGPNQRQCECGRMATVSARSHTAVAMARPGRNLFWCDNGACQMDAAEAVTDLPHAADVRMLAKIAGPL